MGHDHYQKLFNIISEQTVDYNKMLISILIGLFSISPPLWLGWFSARQISYCFRLAEDYRFKATITKSYLGFSDRAQNLGQDHEKFVFLSTLLRFDQEPLRLIEKKFHTSPLSQIIIDYNKTVFSSFKDFIKQSPKPEIVTNPENDRNNN